MAQYWVTHTCGHDVKVELFGPGSGREYAISCMEKKICSEYWKQKVIEENKQKGFSELEKYFVQPLEIILTAIYHITMKRIRER